MVPGESAITELFTEGAGWRTEIVIFQTQNKDCQSKAELERTI